MVQGLIFKDLIACSSFWGFAFASRWLCLRKKLRDLAYGLLISMPLCANGQTNFQRPPIDYYTAKVNDAVTQLYQEIQSGRRSLTWDEKTGWLKSLLNELDVPTSSQTLVFSKTSLQITRISPTRPRAIYFNDDVYVGWVQNGTIEISAVDETQGPIFYSLKQDPNRIVLKRDDGQCMACHASSRTKNVPGYLVRSVFSDHDGTPFYGLGTTTTDHTTPLEKRFGGWYVTGTHGEMRHRGNVIAKKDADPESDLDRGANKTSLRGMFNSAAYLTDSSDIVALMILEHQTQMHNVITRANYEARMAAHHDASMNRLLKRPKGFVSDSTKRRIASAGDKLIDYLLMKDAITFTSPITGTSAFAKEFQQAGKSDRGPSLRELDLKTRLFKYPCSFLIESESYAGLPVPMRDYIEERLARILDGRDQSGDFEYIDSESSKVIRKILSDSNPGFAARLRD